jgi:hypothetical protein
MISQRLSASMLFASCSVVSFLAIAGALPPALEVEKNKGLDQVEVIFGLHAIHQYRADHAAPADQTYQLAHFKRPFK